MIKNKYARKWREDHYEEFIAQSREYNSRPEVKKRNSDKFRVRKYGVGAVEHFEQQIKEQKGLCAICGVPLTHPHQDHNHETKQLRSALCACCNSGLGHIEREGFIEKAFQYLKKWENKARVE